MGFSDRFIQVFRALLPAPFTIAVCLTAITFWLAWFFTSPEGAGGGSYFIVLLQHWEQGMWNNGLLVFALQMMLMLVLGHVLALTPIVDSVIHRVVRYCNTTSRAAAIVTALTVLVALFNWGLGLIFGAILARKVGERAQSEGWKINYPLVGAAGYSGLMVWHGGISGSSLTKVAESGHLTKMMKGLISEEQLNTLPDAIDFSQTVFSSGNILMSIVLLIVLPAGMYWMGRRSDGEPVRLSSRKLLADEVLEERTGAEKLDYSRVVSGLFGAVVLFLVGYKMFGQDGTGFLKFWNPNNINLLLLGLAIVMHGNFNRFLKAIDQAISGAAGILIQFPLYFGIMGIMKGSGMVGQLSAFFVEQSNAFTYPLFTFFSAGLVNIFVPSGGGQWAVQGPIIVQAAQELGVSLPKSIMALAYGDQLTNMLQPFWALPLLGITGLKARDILPYTLYLMLLGGAVFVAAILLF